jgi:hypothetical protein
MIKVDPKEPLEAAAALLAAVAWPEHLPDGASIAAAHAAFVAHALRATADAEVQWQWTKQHIKPGYLLMDPKVVDRSVKRTSTRIRDALKAARAARPFLPKRRWRSLRRCRQQ